MRVLFHIVDFGRGGTETALVGWLRALQSSSTFTAGLSIGFPTAEFDDIYREQLPPALPIHFLHGHPWLYRLHQKKRAGQLGGLGKLARSVLNATVGRYWAKRQMRRIVADYDVVIDFDLSLRHLAGQFDRPWIGVSHFSFAARLAGRPKKIARLGAQYKYYDAIGVLNDAMAHEATTLFGTDIRRAVLLPNAVDIEEVRRRATAALPEAMARLGQGNRPYIVSVARLDEGQKDHRTLIAAYARSCDRGAVAEDLVIVGDGPDRHVLEAAALESGHGARIHFVGYVRNPLPIVAAARALVLSTRYEGLGMVLIEALTLGIPVISSDCPTGPREVLDEGRAGVLVPCGDVDALTDALHRITRDPALRERLTTAGPARAAFYGDAASARRLLAACAIVLPSRFP